MSFGNASEDENGIPVDAAPHNVPLPTPTTTPYDSNQYLPRGKPELPTYRFSRENIEHIYQTDIIQGSVERPATSVPLPSPAATPYSSSQPSLYNELNHPERGISLEELIRANIGDPQASMKQDELRNSSSTSAFSAIGSRIPMSAESVRVDGPPPPISPPPPPTSALSPASYKQTVDELSEHLPHLKNTMKRTRFRFIKLTFYDYVNKQLALPPRSISRDFDGFSEDAIDQFRRDLIQPPDEVDLRFIVVEDLSVELIDILGSVFGMSPEFFEEHLLNSEWRDGTYLDGEADSWNTRGMIKDYVLVRWFRPGLQTSLRPSSVNDTIELLNSRRPCFQWTETVAVTQENENVARHGVRHRLKPTTNIL